MEKTIGGKAEIYGSDRVPSECLEKSKAEKETETDTGRKEQGRKEERREGKKGKEGERRERNRKERIDILGLMTTLIAETVPAT